MRPIRGSQSGRPKTSRGSRRTEGLEIAGDGAPERVRIPGQALGEDGALEDVEGDAGHFEGDVEHPALRPPPPAPHEPLRRRDHGGHEARDVPRREQRRQAAALQAPFLALGGEEAVAEPRREHPALEIVLPVVRGVVDEDVADGGRIAHHGDAAEHPFAGDDGLLEMLRRPGRDEVFAGRLEEVEEVRRARAAAPARAGGTARRQARSSMTRLPEAVLLRASMNSVPPQERPDVARDPHRNRHFRPDRGARRAALGRTDPALPRKFPHRRRAPADSRSSMPWPS